MRNSHPCLAVATTRTNAHDTREKLNRNAGTVISNGIQSLKSTRLEKFINLRANFLSNSINPNVTSPQLDVQLTHQASSPLCHL